MERILFVCVENSCRSQMAEGLMRHFAKGPIEPFSAGSKPGGEVNPEAIKVMNEIGIDISNQGSKGFLDLPVKEFDYVVTLGCKDICPYVPAKKHIDWQIEDPAGKDIEFYRRIRDRIKTEVMKFLKDIFSEQF